MRQLYLQRFEYRAAAAKSEFDQARPPHSRGLQRRRRLGSAEAGTGDLKSYGTVLGAAI
jgi:hypothetical protein